MSTTVVNSHKEKGDVYIGRGSKWGNPYTHIASNIGAGRPAKYLVDTREQAIASYHYWITKGAGKHLLNDLHELKDKKLACWCKPQPCHGDILVELIKKLL